MICERCHKSLASVHITEIAPPAEEGTEPQADSVHEQHLCEACAQSLDLPTAPGISPKTIQDIWKFLQAGAQAQKRGRSRHCPECRMTLDELRRRGKVGCAKDYEVFGDYLMELLERMHGSTQHMGRLPGVAEHELERRQRIGDLKSELARAVREEDYEQAAGLRDELRGLEQEWEAGS
jgi:protein arginine kinase activator